MGKTLIIAEKPSVASDIARVLGGFIKHDDYFESEDKVILSEIPDKEGIYDSIKDFLGKGR